MTLLKDELMEATKLDEATLKQKLIAKAPKPTFVIEGYIEKGKLKPNGWAYITTLYTPSNCDIKDRMLKALK